MKNTVLVVEDEERLSNSLCKHLGAADFHFLQALNGHQALSLFAQYSPDIIILDIMLPDISGVDVCKEIRSRSSVPIIMLTARIDEMDRIKGFEVGADDYVCKPFSPKELIFRIQAILRRTKSGPKKKPNATVKYGPITLYPDQHKATVKNSTVLLTIIEFQLLSVFMAHPDRVFSRAELLTAIHGKYSENYDRTIDTHIKNLRKKVNVSDEVCFIKTIYGVGYRLSSGA